MKNDRTLSLCISAAFLVTCLTWCDSLQANPVTTVTADFDSHRSAGGGPFDGGGALRVGTVGGPNADQRAFIHFDLNDLADPGLGILDAKFRVRFNGNEDEFGGAFLREITSAWAAATVPFAQPAGAQIGGDFLPAAPVAGTYYEVDVTSVLQTWQTGSADPANFYGFTIRGSEGFTSTFKDFNSVESGLPAELVITQIAIPEPSTGTLTTLVVLSLGCVGWRRRRR